MTTDAEQLSHSNNTSTIKQIVHHSNTTSPIKQIVHHTSESTNINGILNNDDTGCDNKNMWIQQQTTFQLVIKQEACHHYHMKKLKLLS